MFSYKLVVATIASLVIAAPVFAADPTDNTAGATATNPTAATPATGTITKGPTGISKRININTASAKQLMKIKGISSTKAKAIVVFRTQNGNFTTLDDLVKVKGFSTLTGTQLENIKKHLTVE